jgi:YD repeat-containing protein
MIPSSITIDAMGHSATYVYNTDGQLTDTTDRDGRRVTFTYDSGGRQTAEDGWGPRRQRRSPFGPW